MDDTERWFLAVAAATIMTFIIHEMVGPWHNQEDDDNERY